MVGTTWRQAVADELARLCRPGQGFTLAEFDAGVEKRVQAMYPDKTTVQAAIRQILQRHRDAGLLTFHDNGHYAFNGAHRPSPSADEASGGLAEAVYQLVARITAETKIAATDYLAVACAPEPAQTLRALVPGGRDLHRPERGQTARPQHGATHHRARRSVCTRRASRIGRSRPSCLLPGGV